MRLDNDFVVPRPVDEAWDVLTDVKRIAPCMPGAQLGEVDGENYHGTVKVKVGPVVAQYAGVARFVELDADRHHAVLEAKGKERSGRGMASARVTADLTGEGDSTRVHVNTELTISGPLAQFGRGAIVEVGSKLLGQFVGQLETLLSAEDAPAVPVAEAEPAPAPAAPAAVAVNPAEVADVEPVDLLQAAWLPVVKRAAPVLVAVVALVIFLRWLMRRGSAG
jgi:carbon monoxide dehydrogenase subunit G